MAKRLNAGMRMIVSYKPQQQKVIKTVVVVAE